MRSTEGGMCVCVGGRGREGRLAIRFRFFKDKNGCRVAIGPEGSQAWILGDQVKEGRGWRDGGLE